MEGLIMTAQLLLSLSILIVVHEWGHFITARMFKIKVEKFYLFFDFLFPMANVLNFSLFKIKKGDTEYGVGWFPLGGYVKIAGMVDESMDKEQMKAIPEPWEFRSKPAWQRLIVMMGGIIVNVIVGIMIFVGITRVMGDTYVTKDYVNKHGGIYALALADSIGLKTGDKILSINGNEFTNFMDVAKPDVLLSQESYYTIERDGHEVRINIPGNFIEKFNRKEAVSNFVMYRVPAIIGKLSPGTLAEKIGLKVGDQITEIDGQTVLYYDQAYKIVKSGPRDSIALKVKRGEQELVFHENFKGQDAIGFYPREIDEHDMVVVKYGIGESIGIGTKRAFDVIFVQLKAFKKLFKGELSWRNSLSGPVGMAKAYGGVWDWQRFWNMTGLLSMVLAFMNFLPIPALDGGYVMFLLYEMISGREPSEKFFENAIKVGMALLLLVMVFVIFNDFLKL